MTERPGNRETGNENLRPAGDWSGRLGGCDPDGNDGDRSGERGREL